MGGFFRSAVRRRKRRATDRGPGPRENRYTLVFGAKGTGKTLYSEGVVRAHARAGGSWVWYDGPGSRGHLGPVVASALELRRLMQEADEAGDPLQAVVQLDYGADSNDLWRPIYLHGGLLLVLDDVQNIADSWRIDAALRELVVKGRHREIDIVTTVQAPPDVHGTLKANRDRVVSFRAADPRYADELATRFFAGDPAAADRLLRLPRWHYLVTDGLEVRYGRIPDPETSPSE